MPFWLYRWPGVHDPHRHKNAPNCPPGENENEKEPVDARQAFSQAQELTVVNALHCAPTHTERFSVSTGSANVYLARAVSHYLAYASG